MDWIEAKVDHIKSGAFAHP